MMMMKKKKKESQWKREEDYQPKPLESTVGSEEEVSGRDPHI